MCGRTSLAVDVGRLANRFGALPRDGVEITERYNIAPGDDLATIQNDAPEEIDTLEWGFIPNWAGDPDDVPNPINARSETAAEKPMFREAFENRRCLILADGFYEWAGRRGSKQPYRIERVDREPYAYAGLWDAWMAPSGEPRATCTILTTEANEVVSEIHDRMPVMLEQHEESAWLDGAGVDEVQAVCDPYPDEKLRAYPVSKRVNNPQNDTPDLLEEVDVGEQSGLDEFGG
ncbi:MAG: SOS response-associated peptidase [Halolamina sp.]